MSRQTLLAGVALILAGIAVSFSEIGAVGFFLSFAGFLVVVRTSPGMRLLLSFILAAMVIIPGTIYHEKREGKRAEAARAEKRQQEESEKKRRVEEVVSHFPADRPGLMEAVASLERLTADKDWPSAEKASRELSSKLGPLLSSTLSTSPRSPRAEVEA